jgi:hypothetical protein
VASRLDRRKEGVTGTKPQEEAGDAAVRNRVGEIAKSILDAGSDMPEYIPQLQRTLGGRVSNAGLAVSRQRNQLSPVRSRSLWFVILVCTYLNAVEADLCSLFLLLCLTRTQSLRLLPVRCHWPRLG